MDKSQYKTQKRVGRHARIRAKVVGTSERPRLAVFRSNRFLYAQLINDDAATTVAAADSRTEKGATPKERAEAVGVSIAKKAQALKLTKVVFDRGGFRYQGTIAALADAARGAGLEF